MKLLKKLFRKKKNQRGNRLINRRSTLKRQRQHFLQQQIESLAKYN